MKEIYLCGHTGSVNRGCEAIVRSTADILKECGVKKVNALTFDENYDKFLNLDNAINLIKYPQKSKIQKIYYYILRKILKNKEYAYGFYHKELKNKINENSITFNIGGDTYCYTAPYISYNLNNVTQKTKTPNVFWGCSVDERVLDNEYMQRDLEKYSFIVTRDTYTYETLKKCVSNPNKVYLACDPAFRLKIKETMLPENFKSNNTLGINISPLVFKNIEDENDIMYQNINELIKFVLSETDMNICLIPHVYNCEKNIQDIKVLRKIYNDIDKKDRVALVDRELSCEELKYIISKTRFFIGARTHSTIAAYSMKVPTIALSYSIKSRGIAKDLFGTEEGFAIPYKSIESSSVLKDTFINILVNKEDEIRNRYEEIMPTYKESIINVAKDIIGKLS